MFLIGIPFAVATGVLIASCILFPWWTLPWVIPLAVVAVVLVVSFVRFVRVREGTATAFETLGRFTFCAFELVGHCFDATGFIVPSAGSNSFGGSSWILRIYGLVLYVRFFVAPVKYRDKNDDDGFGSGYSVLLNQIQRDFTIKKAETTKGEAIPLSLKVAFKMKVVNIYLFLFIAPKDVIAKVIEIMEAIVRAWINARKYDEIQEVNSNGGKMLGQFSNDVKDFIKKVKDDWGVDILEESISIMDVGLLEEDQKAFAEKKRQKLKTAAGAQELLGGMLEVEALSMGLDAKGENKDINAAIAELRNTSEGRKKLEAMVAKANLVVTQRALGVKPNLFGNADGTPLDPVLAGFAALISLAKSSNSPATNPPSGPSGNPASGQGQGTQGQQGGGKGGRFGEDYTEEELEEELKRRKAKGG